MAADKKPQNQIGGASRGLEAVAESPSLAPPEKRERPETPEEKFQRERVTLAEEVTREKSEMIQRERVRKLAEAKEFNPQTLQELQRLDVKKRARDQRREFGTFQAITTVLLARLFAKDSKQQDGSPETFAIRLQETYRLPRPEVAAIIGILQQMNSPDALLQEDIRGIWPELVSLAREVAPTLPHIEAMEKKGWDFPLLQNAKNRVVGFLQEHPNIRRVAIAAGALGALTLLGRWIFGRKKDKTEGGGMFSKVLKVATVGTIAAFAYGYTKRHHEDWISWIKSWFTKEAEKPMFEKLAKLINLDPRLLERLGKESYVTFMKGNLEGDKGWGWVQTKITEGLGIEGAPTGFGKRTLLGLGLPFSGLSIGEVNQVRNFLKQAVEKPEVNAELKKYGVDLNDEKITLATIFAVLNNMENTGALEKALVTSENPENDPDNDVAVEIDDNNLAVVASKTWRELEAMAAEKAPEVRGVLEKWKKKDKKEIIFNIGDFFKELFVAAEKEKKMAFLISAGKIIAWDGVKYVTLASGENIVETAKDALLALTPGTDVDLIDVVSGYLKRGWEFIAIGGAIGAWRGISVYKPLKGGISLVKVKGFEGAFRGAGRGALFTMHVGYKMVRAGARIYHEAQLAPWRFKRLVSGTEAHAQYWAEQAKIEARAYERWYRWSRYARGAGETPLMQKIGAKLLPSAEYEKMLDHYGRRFSNAYERFVKATRTAYGLDFPFEDYDPNIDGRREKIFKIIRRVFRGIDEADIAKPPMTLQEATARLKLDFKPEDTRLAKAWKRLMPILGPLAAAATIYHIEKAQDKKKAVTETLLGIGGFMAGVAATNRICKNLLKSHPRFYTAAIVLGGLLGSAISVKTLERMIDDYFLDFPGAYKASEEVGHILELTSGAYLGKRALALAKGEIATKAAERIGMKGGMKALEEALMKKLVSSTLVKRLGAVASKGVMKKIAARVALKLGARGGMLVAGHAIPGVNVAALAVDVILLPFFAKDMYDIVTAIKNASQLDELMRKRRNYPFVAVEVLEPSDAKRKFEEQKDELMLKGEGAILTFFDQFPHVKIKIKRQDIAGNEIWTFRKGVVEGLAIHDEKGEEIVAMESKDMEQLGEKTFPQSKKEA